MKLLKSKNNMFYQYMFKSLEITYFFLLCEIIWHKKIKTFNFAEYYMG